MLDQIAEISRSTRVTGSRADLIQRSVEVEQSALAAYLMDYLDPGTHKLDVPIEYDEDFMQPVHRAIWGVIRGLVRDNTVVTPAAVLARLGDTELGDDVRAYLGGLSGIVTLSAASPRDAIRLVREMANRRRLADRARELEEMAMSPDSLPADAINAVSPALEEIRLDRQVKPRSLREIALRIADGMNEALPCYATGLPRLDAALGGGIFAKKLYGIAARRKCGKTITAGTIAGNIAMAGTPVLFFALEMGEEGIAQRIIAKQLRTNSIAFLRRTNEHLQADTRRWAESCNVPLFFEDRPGLEFGVLKSLASEYVARHGVKVIVIDYWQLVGGRQRAQSKVDHLDGVAQWLADFAKGAGAAVIMPAQLNRDGETRDGDGLRLACDMYLVQHKVTQPDGRTQGIWIEMPDSRYTETQDLGDENCCPFFISRTGPALEEFGA